MRNVLLGLALLLPLAACRDNETENRLAGAQAEIAALKADLDAAAIEVQEARDLNREARKAIEEVTDRQSRHEAIAAQIASERQQAQDEAETLRAKVATLEARVRELEAAQATVEKPAEPEAETKPAAASNPAVESLTEAVRANPGDVAKVDELAAALHGADKPARDKAISELAAHARANPESKEARLALATVLTTRFRDLRNPMDQGKLASDIKAEVDAALSIDPDYYQAAHFLAVMKCNYPSFTEEFKNANKDCDRALALQANLAWQDSFAEIYAAYAGWYRKQGMFDEALAKVQAGLDKDARNEDLLREKKAIEDARAAAETKE